jgi:hypothetical protein
LLLFFGQWYHQSMPIPSDIAAGKARRFSHRGFADGEARNFSGYSGGNCSHLCYAGIGGEL